jgi:hypothetical protein
VRLRQECGILDLINAEKLYGEKAIDQPKSTAQFCWRTHRTRVWRKRNPATFHICERLRGNAEYTSLNPVQGLEAPKPICALIIDY